MRILIPLIFGFLISTNLKGQNYRYSEIDFSIIVGGCFYNDTISLTVNGETIFDSVSVESDFSTGLTGLTAYQDKKNFKVIDMSNTMEFDKLKIEKSIAISLKVKNKENYSKTLNLKKGKIIVIDYCNRQTKTGDLVKSINAQQYKRNIIFE